MARAARNPAPGHPELVEYDTGQWYAVLWADETRRYKVLESSEIGTRGQAGEWLHERDHLIRDTQITPYTGG